MASVGYFFHGFAGTQALGDPKFYDISGSNNHGLFGEDLSNADAWATAGHVATVNPAGGATDSCIRMPPLNLDYVGGEKLFCWWLGIVTPEAAVAALFGDGISATYPGFRFRVNANGTGQIVMTNSAGTSIFSENSEVMADGEQHSFACVVDGRNRKYGLWVDEIYEHSLFDVYATYGAGVAIDTRNTNTFNLGSASPKIVGDSAVGAGIVSLTRALVVLRFGPTEEMPSVAKMTELCKALRAAPGRLVQEVAVR